MHQDGIHIQIIEISNYNKINTFLEVFRNLLKKLCYILINY